MGYQGCFVERWYLSCTCKEGQSFTDGSARVEGIPRKVKGMVHEAWALLYLE